MSSHTSSSTRPRRTRRGLAALLVLLLPALALVGAATPASADLGDPGRVTLDKRINGGSAAAVDPGESFEYSFVVGCDDNPCIGATLDDALPEELEGFAVADLTVSPAQATVAIEGCPEGELTDDCVLHADFAQPLGDLGGTPVVGIQAGTTFIVSLVLTVPADLTPLWPWNGEAIVNSATAAADNSPDAVDTATLTVSVERDVDVTVTKAWDETSVQFAPGQATSLRLGVANASNVPADRLVLQDPTDAAEGATALPTSNPFRLVDLVGLCTPSTLPAGADQVQVDVYVRSGGTWSWVTGTPQASPVLPAGTDADQVAGLRFTYTSTAGTEIDAQGAAASQCVQVAQRATDRETGADLVSGATVANEATGTVVVPDQDPVTRPADDTLVVAPLTVEVEAGKQITPTELPASGSFSVDVSARNASNGPLEELTLSEPGAGTTFLSEDLRFAGFTAVQWPTGADGGQLVWTYSDGSSSAPVALVEGGPLPVTPTPPAGRHITGLTTTWTGQIVAGTSAGWSFDVDTDPETVPEGTPSEDFTNTVDVTGTNPAGSDDDRETADVTVYRPTVGVELDKRISPPSATAGGTVVAGLSATTSADVSAVRPTTITVTDRWDGTDTTSMWDAFRARAVLFTDIPSGATLTVQYTTSAPGDEPVWQTLDTAGSDEAPYSVDLPDPLRDDITGLTFVFENPAGFAQGTSVQPNVVFAAAPTLRSTGEPTAEPDGEPVGYDNLAVTTAQGQAGTLTVEAEPDEDDGQVSVVAYTGNGTVLSAKRWVGPDGSADLAGLPAQSGSTARTALGWGVTTPGYAQVLVSDALPGSETTPEQTVFQAFDLRAIRPISYAQDPLLRWDTVSQVELFLSDGAGGGTWTALTAPGGSWMDGTGFTGWTLTPEQSAATTGVRLTVVPNDAARTAEGADPTRPAPGSGVAWSAAARPLGLEWELRNRVRVEGAAAWVTADTVFNEATPGAVRNDVRVAATVAGGPTVSDDDSDTVTVVDAPPGVGVAKSASPALLVAPYPGEVDATDYPTADFTVETWNTSSARASYLRVTDPGCTTVTDCVTAADDHDPDVFTGRGYAAATNPFERLTLTGVDVSVPAAAPVDHDASQAAVWRRAADGTTSVQRVSLADLEAMAPADFADVVGLAVVYQSTAPETTGGLLPRDVRIVLTLHTQLRATLRSAPETATTGTQTVDNAAVAQGFDPVLTPSGSGAQPYGSDAAQIEVTDAALDATAHKQFSRPQITEPEADQPVAVTLTATDGSATLAPQTVSIIDTDADFWAAFALTGLGAVTRPAGADLVRVDVRLGGSTEWVLGQAAPTAALPAAVTDPSVVTGIRLVYLNEDGRPFSATVPSADWTASAVLDLRLRPGVSFPGSVSNTVRTTADHEGRPQAAGQWTDTIVLTLGTPRISVQKDAPVGHVVSPGEEQPWRLTFTNIGDSYLGVERLHDVLGPYLRYAGSQPTYTSTGELPTDGITVSQPDGGEEITFTFPPGARMAPGDTFTVELGVILLPGLSSGQRATNELRVVLDRDLAPEDCVNVSGNGQGLLDDLAADECGTSNYVLPFQGPLLFAEKEVRADVDGDLVSGAVNVTNPALPCSPQPGGWYRTVCTPYTVAGGTDEWRVGVVNTGTVGYTDLTFVDVLPRPGDVLLATGAARQSDFRPVLDGDAGVRPDVVPPGATYTAEVTTAATACTGASGDAWATDPTCAATPWEAWDGYTGDWADVTALRVHVDLPDGEPLAPGQTVSFVYRTVNTPGGDEAVPPALWSAPYPRAWNQVGTAATLTTGSTLSRAPARTGVQLVAGALEVTKTASGDARGLAPDEVLVDVACTVAGTAVDLGDRATLAVPVGGAARIDGLPLGADCSVAEQGEVGAYGETSRDPAGSRPVDVDVPVEPGQPVPAVQVVTLDNRYDTGALAVTKRVDSAAAVPGLGPWAFSVACTAPLGQPVLDTTFTLSADETWHAPDGVLPVGSSCRVAETDAGAAGATWVSGDGVSDGGDGTATVVVGATSEVVVTNAYAVGPLAVTKVVTGVGAQRYGAGPFEVAATCTWPPTGEVVYTGTVRLGGGQTVRFQRDGADVLLAAGTSCTLTETVSGPVSSAPVLSPGATVTVTGGEPGGPAPAEATTVTVTNVFDTVPADPDPDPDPHGGEVVPDRPGPDEPTPTQRPSGPPVRGEHPDVVAATGVDGPALAVAALVGLLMVGAGATLLVLRRR